MADDLDLCDASAKPETNPRTVQLRFSDGSSRSLEVTVGVGVKAFYFPPAVAFSLQVVQVDGAQASTAAGLETIYSDTCGAVLLSIPIIIDFIPNLLFTNARTRRV